MKHSTTIESDAYFKKLISYACRHERFDFAVGHTLFSSFQIDDGTDLLLRTLTLPDEPPTAVLDLGCGCGVLGVVLARLCPVAHVTLADKDLLAVRYARYNAAQNDTPNTTVIGSVGLENVPEQPFDLIVSNIPAKIGDDAIEQEFVLGPLQRLRLGGEYWFVVVSGLNHLIPRIGSRNHLRLKEIKKRSGYTVYRLRNE